jgi:hypothetical protein
MTDRNKRLAELLRICHHDEGVWGSNGKWTCEKCGAEVDGDNPTIDFTSDPRLVLREMRKIGKLARFLSGLNAFSFDEDGDMIDNAVPVECILNTTGLLADKAIEFLEKMKEHKESNHE